jgi:cytochrome c oxidase subunit 3
MASSEARPVETGVWIGIAAITMSFAALTSALVVRQGSAPDWQHFRLPPILYLNTAVLLASSATLERARRRSARSAGRADAPEAALRAGVAATLVLGMLFLSGQGLAWRALAAQGLFLATNPSSSFFYVLTAVHGLHLAGGLVALAYVWVRLRRRPGTAARRALGATALYWHFVDGLWVYLLSILSLRV